mmetsp:Transcript_10220/g.29188  ORF Transcript_10220/g.29188 Transcript_10220/m.29188 type:complete len:227 (-) Transcript_10220:1647-2327(-)
MPLQRLSTKCPLHCPPSSVWRTQARYLYIRLSVLSLSRYSRSIRLSMRFLMNAGFGMNRELSCLVTSAMRSLCCSVFLAFIILTTPASTSSLLSSSTGAGTSPPVAGASSFIDTSGIFTLFILLVYSGLKVKESSSAMFLPLLDLRRMRCFGVQREIRWRRRSLSGILSSLNSRRERVGARLNIIRMHIWYVLTIRSWRFAPNKPLTSAEPILVCQFSFLPLFELR